MTLTPPCSTTGCPNPSVHRVDDLAQEIIEAKGVYMNIGFQPIWLCVPCYERKVWGR